MFEIGDKVAHPGHGACMLNGICERTIGGECVKFYELSPCTEKATNILVPVENASDIGIRDIITEDEANNILESLPNIETQWTTNHHKRYQESLEALKSRDLWEVAEVLKTLMMREPEAKLTNTDRDMLRKVQKKLLSELALAKGIEFQEILENVEETFSNIEQKLA